VKLSAYLRVLCPVFFHPRDAMVAQVPAMALCLCLSVTSRCSIEMGGQIELVCGMCASFDLSHTVL